MSIGARLTDLLFGRDPNEFRLVRKIDAFSLNASQLYVGELANDKGDTARGLSIVGAGSGRSVTYGSHVYVFTASDSNALVDFLNKLLAHELPASFRFPPASRQRWFSNGAFDWKVTDFDEDWHGGGAFEGTLGGGFFHKISRSSASRLRQCVLDHLPQSTVNQ